MLLWKIRYHQSWLGWIFNLGDHYHRFDCCRSTSLYFSIIQDLWLEQSKIAQLKQINNPQNEADKLRINFSLHTNLDLGKCRVTTSYYTHTTIFTFNNVLLWSPLQDVMQGARYPALSELSFPVFHPVHLAPETPLLKCTCYIICLNKEYYLLTIIYLNL